MIAISSETVTHWLDHVKPKLALLVLVLLVSTSGPKASTAPAQQPESDSLSTGAADLATVLPALEQPVPTALQTILADGGREAEDVLHTAILHVLQTRSDALRAPGAVVEGKEAGVRELGPVPWPVLQAGRRTDEDTPCDSADASVKRTAEPLSPVDGSMLPDDAVETCPIDERGRPRCPSSPPPPPLSIRDRGSELAAAAHEFGEWVIATTVSVASGLRNRGLGARTTWALAMVVLHLAELACLVVEDAVIKTLLGWPMPPSFPMHKAIAFSKRLSRLRFRLRCTWQRLSSHLAILGAVAVVLTTFVWEVMAMEPAAAGRPWQQVPLGRWLMKGEARDAAIPAVRKGVISLMKVARPARALVMLELVSATIYLAQPLKHVLPAYLVPPNLAVPSTVLSRFGCGGVQGHRRGAGPSAGFDSHEEVIQLDTHWLVSQLSDLVLTIVTLTQLFIVLPFLPSWSPLALPFHVFFLTSQSLVGRISRLVENLRRTVDCLAIVNREFEDTVPDACGSHGGSGSSDWVCTICMEGDEVELAASPLPSPRVSRREQSFSELDRLSDQDAAAASAHSVQAKKRCRLVCGHRYHAQCLVHWLHYQSFCPVCHIKITAAPTVTSSNSEILDTTDLYPTQLRRRRPPAMQGFQPDPFGTIHA